MEVVGGKLPVPCTLAWPFVKQCRQTPAGSLHKLNPQADSRCWSRLNGLDSSTGQVCAAASADYLQTCQVIDQCLYPTRDQVPLPA